MANFLFKNNTIDVFNNFNNQAVKTYLLLKEFNPTLSCSVVICTCSQCNIIKSNCLRNLDLERELSLCLSQSTIRKAFQFDLANQPIEYGMIRQNKR